MTGKFKPGDRVMVVVGPDEVLHRAGTVLHAPTGYVVVAVDGYGGHIAHPDDLEALPPPGVTKPAAWLRTAAKNLKRRFTNWGDGSTVTATDDAACRLLLEAARLCDPYNKALELLHKIRSVPVSVRAEDYAASATLWVELAYHATEQASAYDEKWAEAISGDAARSARSDDERGNA